MSGLAYQMTFQRPVVAEVTGSSGLGALGVVQSMGLGALGADSNPVSQVIDSIIGGAGGLLETITGAKGQREARAEAARIAELQAQRAVAEAQASAQLWTKALPWVVIGGVGLLGIVVLSRR